MNPILRLKTFNRTISILLLFAVVFSQATIAQTIGNWDFNGTITGTGSAGNSVSTAQFSPAIPTVAFNGGTEYYGQNGWPAAGISTTSYMEFTLTPKSGHYLSILSVTLRMRRSNTGTPSGSGPVKWSLRSSIDGFANDLYFGTMSHNYANYTVLTGGGFGYITGTVTFRVYGYEASTSSGGNSRMVFDNISVAGMGPVLPVHLLSMSAQTINQKVQISYELANTEPGTNYTLERSTDGNNFSAINTKSETQSIDHVVYNYIDAQIPSGIEKIYYRLRMIDLTGSSSYSSVVYVQLQANSELKAHLKGQTLLLTGHFNGNEQLSLYNSTGIFILSRQLLSGQSVQFTTPAIPKGVYYVVVQRMQARQTIVLVNE